MTGPAIVMIGLVLTTGWLCSWIFRESAKIDEQYRRIYASDEE